MADLRLTKSDAELRTAFYALRTRRDVAALLNVSPKTLNYLTVRQGAPRYRQFMLKKRTGGTRIISAPDGSLKIIQQKLNQILQAVYQPKAPVHGFTRDRSILTNAHQHRHRNLVLNIDLEDFFPSIHFGRVRGVFMGKRFRLPLDAAQALAQICVLKTVLPAGAPTSPVVSNLICAGLDAELRRLAVSVGCRYTRYADDITFSTDRAAFSRQIARVQAEG